LLPDKDRVVQDLQLEIQSLTVASSTLQSKLDRNTSQLDLSKLALDIATSSHRVEAERRASDQQVLEAELASLRNSFEESAARERGASSFVLAAVEKCEVLLMEKEHLEAAKDDTQKQLSAAGKQLQEVREHVETYIWEAKQKDMALCEAKEVCVPCVCVLCVMCLCQLSVSVSVPVPVLCVLCVCVCVCVSV
jgi:hypothetical protein